MRTAIVSSNDLDQKDLRAKRYAPAPLARHSFTVITAEDADAKWEWCIRCGTLRFNGEYITPGPKQTMVVKGKMDATACKARRARS